MSKTYVVNLTLDELSVIGAGLNQISYGVAKPLIEKIEGQINAQMVDEVSIDEVVPE